VPVWSLRGLRALAVAAAAAALATSVLAQEDRSYWVESFHAEIIVQPDGALDVTERLTFAFVGSFNGIYRDIPWRYRTPWGLDYELRITPLAVLGEDGDVLEHEAGRRSNDYRFKVWVPGAADAERVVTLRYRVERGLRFFDAGDEGFEAPRDELYWNVTGDRWEVPIRRATARVQLPQAVDGNVSTRAFTGAYGSAAETARIRQPESNEIVFQVADELEPGEGLTIVVGWPEGAVRRPTAADAAGYLLRDNWPLLIPVFALIAMFLVHRRWGRDPVVDRSIMVQYEPPGGYRPAELGTLIDERVDLRDIVATVIDLGVRGYLRIEETTESGWLSESTTTRLIKLREPDADLRDYEKTILDGLFESGDDVSLDDLQTKFYSHASAVKKALYTDLTTAGLFRGRPDRVRAVWLVLAAPTLLVMLALGGITERPAFFFAAPFTAVIVAAFGWQMPARTRTGRGTYLELKGFEEFLSRTEGARLRELDLPATTFEKLLPYAMAFGVASHWASAFAGLVKEPPQWYRGNSGVFDTIIFTQHMQHLNSRMGTALTSQPRSSGSGSSGGSGFSGGFSGGGFGGGGGGAF
jgi:uncharacterized membrane protein YgcG